MAAVGGISLFTSRKGGHIRARWGKGKHRVDWNTHTHDPERALELAAEELRRRSGPSAAQQGTPQPRPAVTASTSSQPPVGGPPPPAAGDVTRRPLGDVLARVLIPPSPAPIGQPPTAPAAVAPDAVIDPAKAAAEQLEREAAAKVRHVHKVVGKGLTYITEGCLKRLCRFAGREPDDIDDDEEILIREGFEELAGEYLGKYKLTPWGKVGAGTFIAGVGMYLGGKEIPKPKPTAAQQQGQLRLVEQQQQQQRPEGDGGKSA